MKYDRIDSALYIANRKKFIACLLYTSDAADE